MEIKQQQSTFNNNNNNNNTTTNNNNNNNNTEFHDALDEFPFLDASNSCEESYESISSSSPDIKEDETTITFISEHSPDSPYSPSAAGLRHRRLASPQSRFFKNNPEGLIDFNPTGLGKKNKLLCSLKDNETLNENLSSDSHESSAITSVSDEEKVNNESTTVDSPSSGPDLLFTLAELVIGEVSFQTKPLAKSLNFSIWLIGSSYMLLNDPYGVIRHGGIYVQGSVSGIWGFCYNSGVKLVNWFQTHESASKLCVQIGWGLLWLAYCGFILVCLLIPAFVFGAVVVNWIVEEPVQITEQLTFDYTKDTPMAFVPVIHCLDSSSMVKSQKSETGSFAELQVIPFDHELKATVSLVLPESDYNRRLGIFQVRVDFLSSDGTLLASTRKPSMLQFKSEPIRLLSTFLKLAYLLTGYPSETQTLDIELSGYTEKDVPLSCLRVVIEQRAEFAKGGGVPEIYSASLKLESQFPFLKRMLWYWKGLIYMWISIMMFITELLITLLCCTPIIFPWVRRVGGSSINSAAHNKPPG